jgi:DNA mismatch endonuclease (patch repair protein)
MSEMGRTSSSKERAQTSKRPVASSPHVRLRMQATPRRDTPAELALRSAVHKLGLRFRVDWRLPETRRRADLAFVKARVAVFVDGCFWHACPDHGTWPKANAVWWRAKILANVERDRDTDRRLRGAGWCVLRFWEHEPCETAAKRIARTLATRRGQPHVARR